MESTAADAERAAHDDYAALLDVSVVSVDKTREFNAEVSRLRERGAELQRVAEGVASERKEAQDMSAAAAAQLGELKRVFALIDRVAAHVHRVDAAVAAMETAVGEVARQQTVTALRSALSPMTRLFGGSLGGGAESSPPFARPPASFFDASVA